MIVEAKTTADGYCRARRALRDAGPGYNKAPDLIHRDASMADPNVAELRATIEISESRNSPLAGVSLLWSE